MDLSDVNFVEKSKKRTLTDVDVNVRESQGDGQANSKLEMRINKLTPGAQNLVTIRLIFKLDYCPQSFIDVYTIYLTLNIEVYDRDLILVNDPLADLSVAYMATHFKESGERLYKELNDQYKKIFSQKSGLQGKFSISEDEAQEQIRQVLTDYSI